MAGEDAGDKGEEGVLRAKKWLERTTRVRQSWTRHDHPMDELLHFKWPHGGQQAFSFDLGGRFAGGDIDGGSFVAEVKNYVKESDLSAHFSSFLAKCYVAYQAFPKRCGSLLWISWSPFQAQKWDEHHTFTSIQTAVTKNRARVLGESGEFDPKVAYDIVPRIHRITMSTKLEELVILDEYYDRYILPEIMGAKS